MKPYIFILLFFLFIARVSWAQPDADEAALPTPDSSGQVAQYAFGYSDPLLECAPLRVCLIELQPGETIVNPPIAGDNARWMIEHAYQKDVPLILVKPTSPGLATNLIITTDRRIYDVSLESHEKPGFTRRLRFYYPGERLKEPKPIETQSINKGPALSVPLEELNFNYSFRRGKGFPWAPLQVFDDGSRVYIRLTEEAMKHELPPLFVETEAGREVITFLPPSDESRTYVTDRLFDQAAFVFSRQKGRRFKEVKLVITHERANSN